MSLSVCAVRWKCLNQHVTNYLVGHRYLLLFPYEHFHTFDLAFYLCLLRLGLLAYSESALFHKEKPVDKLKNSCKVELVCRHSFLRLVKYQYWRVLKLFPAVWNIGAFAIFNMDHCEKRCLNKYMMLLAWWPLEIILSTLNLMRAVCFRPLFYSQSYNCILLSKDLGRLLDGEGTFPTLKV